jgi:hypothetical protein
MPILDLVNNDKVVWNTQKTGIPGGAGYVKGVATVDQPGTGRGIIVRLDYPVSGYPFECLVIPESLLTKLEAL